MLSQAEERLIRWLGRFPASLDNAWDVPREVSLPGLSEAMGVVRSALDIPLNVLVDKELVLSKIAHVIGGGSRRRSIYLLTQKGRDFLAELPENKEEQATDAAKKGTISGAPPTPISLLGRESEVKEIISTLKETGCAIITGLPGIGKSSLIREVCDVLTESGKDIAWARATSFDDLSSLFAGAFSGAEVPTSTDAACDWIVRKLSRGVLIIDELQEIHSRHIRAVVNGLEIIAKSNTDIIIASRAPCPIEIEKSTISLGELSRNDSLDLLGDSIEKDKKMQVIEVLGGHPLALKLYEEGDDIPEVGADILAYVEENVLANLPEDVMPGLDELAAMPLPVPAERLAHEEAAGLLDDHALLRWVGDEDPAIELQHLIRNVRQASWDEKKSIEIYSAAAKHWAGQPEMHARLIEFHHRLKSNDSELEDFVENYSESLMAIDDGAMSVLLHEAIERQPEVKAFWRLAANCALDRGEKEIVSQLLQDMPESENDAEMLQIRSRLALQKGNVSQAKKLQDEAQELATPAQSVRFTVSYLGRLLDDRLPRCDPALPFAELFAKSQNIDLSNLAAEARQNSLVAIACLRHSIALQQDDFKSAGDIRKQLASLSSTSDPLIEELALRSALKEAEYGSSDWHKESEILRKKIHSAPPLRALALRLILVEMLWGNDNVAAKILLDEAELDIQLIPTSRRLLAIVWYWRGMFDDARSLECWREAIHRFRTAECPHAAQQLALKMHAKLR